MTHPERTLVDARELRDRIARWEAVGIQHITLRADEAERIAAALERVEALEAVEHERDVAHWKLDEVEHERDCFQRKYEDLRADHTAMMRMWMDESQQGRAAILGRVEEALVAMDPLDFAAWLDEQIRSATPAPAGTPGGEDGR